MASNELFQFSLISALMDGVASSGLPISEILEHGDHGLGTFQNLVGELIVLDGEAYQMKSDGSIISLAADPGKISPFAAVTRFRPTVKDAGPLRCKQDLYALVSKLLPSSHNHFVAIRVDGTFSLATVRTVGGQTTPHEGLVDVGKHQTSHTLKEAMVGTIVGIRSPKYMQGISVAGDHLIRANLWVTICELTVVFSSRELPIVVRLRSSLWIRT